MEIARTPAAITLSVWKALFLREAVHRLFSSRAAWLWLLSEPMVHVAFMTFIFTVARAREVGGIDTVIWLMLGMLSFFTFRRTAMQAMYAVGANKALFAYRQVKPVDTVLTRAALEGFLMAIVSSILFAGAALFHHSIIPDAPLTIIAAFSGLWLAGLGFGLIGSVADELVPELGKIINLLLTPLYFMSGILFPISMIPPPYGELILFNPIAHGVEAARSGFATYYVEPTGLSLPYLYGFALVTVFFGLALHARFSMRLIGR